MKTTIYRLGLFLSAVSLLGGCAVAAVGGATATAIHDRRSVGNLIDDQGIELTALNRLYRQAAINKRDHIKVTSYNGIVLLAGEVQNEHNHRLAKEITQQVAQVKRVVNELSIRPETSVGTRLDDSYLTGKVNTILLKENPIVGFDATRIKVTTVRDIVYLMGLVSQQEAEAVASVVSNIKGVNKVVKVFEYTD